MIDGNQMHGKDNLVRIVAKLIQMQAGLRLHVKGMKKEKDEEGRSILLNNA